MHTYEVEVNRDGRWYMIHIPELDGLTQARWPGEIKRMAREYIAVSTSTPIRDVAVRVVKRSKNSSWQGNWRKETVNNRVQTPIQQ
jgi:hypothetical protein